MNKSIISIKKYYIKKIICFLSLFLFGFHSVSFANPSYFIRNPNNRIFKEQQQKILEERRKRRSYEDLQERSAGRASGEVYYTDSYDEFFLQRFSATERSKNDASDQEAVKRQDEAEDETETEVEIEDETATDAGQKAQYHLQAAFSCTELENNRIYDGLQAEDPDVVQSALPNELVKNDIRAALFLIEAMKAHNLIGLAYYLSGDFEEDLIYTHTVAEEIGYPEVQYEKGFNLPASYFAYSRYLIGGVLKNAFSKEELEGFFAAQEKVIKSAGNRVQINILKAQIADAEREADKMFNKKFSYQPFVVEETVLLLAGEALVAYGRTLKCPHIPETIGNEEAPPNYSSQEAYEVGYGYIWRAIGLLAAHREILKNENNRVAVMEDALQKMGAAFPEPFFPVRALTPFSTPAQGFNRLNDIVTK